MTNDERDEKINAIHKSVNILVTSVAVSNERVDRHDRSLYGNGNPGLCTRVQKIEDRHDNNSSGVATFLAWLGAITSIVAVFAAVFALLK